MAASWSRRRVLRSIGSFGGVAVLSGCGFHPVYMPTASGGSGPAERNMAAIQVALIPDRPGQLLRQALQQRLGSDSGGVSPRYKLSVSYTIEGQGVAVAPDSTPTFMRLIGRAMSGDD